MELQLAFSAWGWVLVGVAILLFLGVAYGLYTRRGSEIEQHPHGRRRGGMAPGAQGPSEVTGRDEGEERDWERGTR